VVDKFIIELEEQLSERNITFDLTGSARNWLAERGYDVRFGARAMGRKIHEAIKEPLADEILFGRLEHGGRVQVDVDEDKLTFRFPDREIEGPIEGESKDKEPVKV
jgi:ATP-dependent Clp protease ATP-binding subunit ClpA